VAEPLLPATTYMDVVGEGTINADGMEQTVISKEDNKYPFVLGAWLDLSKMDVADTITLREYVKVKKDGMMVKYDASSYAGIQPSPALFITSKPSVYGIKVTLQQTAGALKSFDFIVFRQQSAIDRGAIIFTS